jgi:2-polyprenyl-3-methyl-5-hydroxy-6-metoxy-1,4-benzoquinol methylase
MPRAARYFVHQDETMANETAFVVSQGTEAAELSERFAFGENWQRFLRYLTEERIAEAEKSLRSMLECEDLRGKTFVDIGNGSGLFSLAAMRLGAAGVHSFDFDPESVACAQELKRRYFETAANWTIQQGSVLDEEYLARLGQFDIVYSWGVLHHTGNMWQALANVAPLVADRGRLFIALYNDQDIVSTGWKTVKRWYNRSRALRMLLIPLFTVLFGVVHFVKDFFFLGQNPLRRYQEYGRWRGMAYTTDLLDWLGGYPFEVAKTDEVFEFYRARGFELVRLRSAGISLGNNEFVFVKR